MLEGDKCYRGKQKGDESGQARGQAERACSFIGSGQASLRRGHFDQSLREVREADLWPPRVNVPDHGPEARVCLVDSRARRRCSWLDRAEVGAKQGWGDSGRSLDLVALKDVGFDSG